MPHRETNYFSGNYAGNWKRSPLITIFKGGCIKEQSSYLVLNIWFEGGLAVTQAIWEEAQIIIVQRKNWFFPCRSFFSTLFLNTRAADVGHLGYS